MIHVRPKDCKSTTFPDSHQAAAHGDPRGCGAAEGEGGEGEQQLHGGGVTAGAGAAWLYRGPGQGGGVRTLVTVIIRWGTLKTVHPLAVLIHCFQHLNVPTFSQFLVTIVFLVHL